MFEDIIRTVAELENAITVIMKQIRRNKLKLKDNKIEIILFQSTSITFIESVVKDLGVHIDSGLLTERFGQED